MYVCVCVCMYIMCVCVRARARVCIRVCVGVCMYVCMYVHFYLENRYTDLHQTWHTYFLKPERDIGRSKLRKSVLSSSPGEGGPCSSETKHDRRTAPWTKLFVSKRRLLKQRPQPRKPVWGSTPGEDLARKLGTIEKRRQDQSCLFRRVDYRNKGQNPENLSWVRVPVKISLAWKLGTIREQGQQQSRLFRRRDYMKKMSQPRKSVLGFRLGEGG
jgi:hypothetical protein